MLDRDEEEYSAGLLILLEMLSIDEHMKQLEQLQAYI